MARKKRSERDKADYQARKADGRCTYPGCSLRASDDALLCAAHHSDAKARKKSSAASIRKARRTRGLCAACGKVKSKTYRCVSCSGVENGVDKTIVLYFDPDMDACRDCRRTRGNEHSDRSFAATFGPYGWTRNRSRFSDEKIKRLQAFAKAEMIRSEWHLFKGRRASLPVSARQRKTRRLDLHSLDE